MSKNEDNFATGKAHRNDLLQSCQRVATFGSGSQPVRKISATVSMAMAAILPVDSIMCIIGRQIS
jgi:hypothetical protein